MSLKPQASTKTQESLIGTVERVTFHNPENGFAVLRLKVRGQKEPVTVVGTTPVVAAGEWAHAEGGYVNDRAHGLQFRATSLVTRPPSSKDAIERYLASGTIKGIGVATAARIVDAFGKDTFSVLDSQPQRLREVIGLTEARIERIVKSWQEERAVRDIGLFLQEHGIGMNQSRRIVRALGPNAIGLVREDPYRLARDVKGIGFRTSDALALKLGLEPDSMQRLRAGITFTLQEAMSDGHCGLPLGETIEAAMRLLDAREDKIRQAIDEEVAAKRLVRDALDGAPALFLPDLFRAEKAIAERLMAMQPGGLPWPSFDAAKDMNFVEERTKKTLASSQRAALNTLMGAKVAVMTGGPGVGKTTLLDAVLRLMRRAEMKVILAAPTGRAAKRMTEQTGIEAKTIHRLLEIDPDYGGFRRARGNELEADLIVVDEMSMVDVPLFAALIEAVPLSCALLMVGDIDQLPPVGPGQVLSDIIASAKVPVARLTEVFRQAKESRIIENAHRINGGEMPEPPPPGETSDFFMVGVRNAEDGLEKIIEMVAERIPKKFGLDPIRDVQVLSPMNKGELGARNLTIALQKALNPAHGRAHVERFGWTYCVGDRVMQTANDYDRDVFNGDLGTVLTINNEDEELIAQFDGRKVSYAFQDLEVLMPAYAVTIHKSQGSEYPAVIIPITMQHYPMLARNLIYTGVTRGKHLVVLIGEKRAIEVAVRGGRTRRRYSKLKEWLG